MLTTKQIELIENSWDFILINAHDTGLIFYNRLFELDPSLKSLFKEDIRSQSQKLVALITFAVHKLRNIDLIIADVEALGRRHKKYNVQPEHYAIVAQALLHTLAKVLGDKWNSRHEEAWTALYTMLADTMIRAAEPKAAS